MLKDKLDNELKQGFYVGPPLFGPQKGVRIYYVSIDSRNALRISYHGGDTNNPEFARKLIPLVKINDDLKTIKKNLENYVRHVKHNQ